MSFAGRMRLEAIRADGSETLNVPRARVHTLRALNEAEAKARLAAAGIPVPKGRACDPVEAADIAGALGFPVAVKALDATLLHKSEVGGVALGLNNRTEVAEAVARMQDSLRTDRVLIEHMAPASVAEVMASVTTDLAVGRVMVIAGGGVQAELWSDQRLIAAPFTRQQIETALALTENQHSDRWLSRSTGRGRYLAGGCACRNCGTGRVQRG